MNKDTAFLLTGGTGFLGRRLLRRLLEDQCKVIALCRGGRTAAGGAISARSRMLALIDELGCSSRHEQVFVIDADLADLDPAALTLDIRAGLRQLDAAQLVSLNVAASLKMDYEGQAEAKREATRTLNYRTNVQGVERLLQALDGVEAASSTPMITGMVHFSTCYAHGRREGLLPESAIDPAFATENSYEQTKREGEALVARWQAQRAHPVPVSIVRPSIVTGPDTRDGYLAWLDIMAEPVSLERLSGWKRWLIGIEAPRAGLMELVGAVVRRLHIPIVPMLGNGGGILDLIDASDVEKYSWLVVQRHRAGLTPGLRYLHISNPEAPSLRQAWALTVSAFGQQEIARRTWFFGGFRLFAAILRLFSTIPVAGKGMRSLFLRTSMLKPYLMRPSGTRFETSATAAFFAEMGVRYETQRIDLDYVRSLLAQPQTLPCDPEPHAAPQSVQGEPEWDY